MIRISLPWLIEVVEAIDALDQLGSGKSVLEVLEELFTAQAKMEQVFDQSIYGGHLRACRVAGGKLYESIKAHIDNNNWAGTILNEFDIVTLKARKATFKTVFLADLSAIPSYLVGKKDNFDVTLLIEDGVRLFPPNILIKAPEVEKDSSEVGRALAFELPTSCGFHTFRVTESIVRRYWDQVSEGKERPSLETLGSFASEMEKRKFGETKIIESLKQMTKLHRNPLIHPEVILTLEEAIGIIGMARSVIGPMLQVLPDAPSTTGAPASVAATA